MYVLKKIKIEEKNMWSRKSVKFFFTFCVKKMKFLVSRLGTFQRVKRARSEFPSVSRSTFLSSEMCLLSKYNMKLTDGNSDLARFTVCKLKKCETDFSKNIARLK